MLVAVVGVSCSALRKYDRVETTSVERYNIVYDDGKCGLYDIQADSLVTAIKYDVLKYGRTTSEQGIEFTVWTSQMDNYVGMIAVDGATNSATEIMFPR